MTSYHPEILSGDRFWVDLSKKTIVVEIRQSSCLLNFGTDTLLFDFNLEKKNQAKRKSMNQTLFSTKSITLNPMVQSDLVTYMGVTLLILFLKATITLYIPHLFFYMNFVIATPILQLLLLVIQSYDQVLL